MAETQSTMPQAAEMPKQSDVSSDPWPDASKPLQFKVQYGRTAADLKRPAESTVNELKTEVEKIFGVPSNRQKLMFKGMGLKNDDYSLEKVGLGCILRLCHAIGQLSVTSCVEHGSMLCALCPFAHLVGSSACPPALPCCQRLDPLQCRSE